MNENIETIKHKLNVFFRKYYTSMLIRGLILFCALGGLYFLFSIALEHFLWLPPSFRTLLFWSFIAVSLFLFIRFILLPLLFLFRIREGLNDETASRLIGKHFPEVDDKLLNLLQLHQQPEKSELLLASLEQRSKELEPIPFEKAVNLRKNVKYLNFLAIPLVIVLLIWLSGKTFSFKSSYERLVDHTSVYSPPAPFTFEILNDSLTAVEGVPFTLRVTTQGKIAPEMVQIERNGEWSYMQPNSQGIFEYPLQTTAGELRFSLHANGVVNGPYSIKVLPVPSLMHFNMHLDYPTYTGKKDEDLENSGNATVPEGTKVTWNVRTRNTEQVELILKDTTIGFDADENNFQLYQLVYNDLSYEIASSNSFLQRFEALGFHINVIKDQYPKITTKREIPTEDRITKEPITGEISDDYGLSKLELIYYPEGKEESQITVLLSKPQGNLDKFRYTFPGNLALKENTNYLFYFKVTDNDRLRAGGKTAKSTIYSYYKLSKNELQEQQLNRQKEKIQDLDKTLERMKEQERSLEELNNINRQQSELNFNDKRRLNNFINRQEQQEQLMKAYTRKLQEDLENFPGETPETEEFNELLRERLERQQLEIEKNEKLLEELQEYTEKLDKQELEQRLEELAKKQQSNKRNLEQVLELTKRYYVQTKAAHLKNNIEELAQKQDSLSRTTHKEELQQQDSINKAFNKTAEAIRSLEKENKALKKPMNLGTDEKKEEEIKQDQQNSLEQLRSPEDQSNANDNQKKAAQKLKKLAAQMQSSMSMQNASSLNEDMNMLRQILDNLLKFTFDQEDIMDNLNTFNSNSSQLPQQLKNQNDLKDLFEHIDDSLFALSLRRPELGEIVNTNITEVYYNINKSLERFADNQYYQGITHQQYTLTAANNLSDFLSNTLDQMQNMMMGESNGEGQGFQLPDIIKSQGELNKKMQEGMGNSDGPNEGDEKNSQKSQEESSKQGTREQDSQALFEIYKQQQQIREALREQIKNIQGTSERQRAEQLVRQMDRIEEDLLNNGSTEQTLRRMQSLKHQLMQLESAEQLQGEKKERKSTTNRKEYTQNSSNQSPELQESYQELEILQRQVLPLREIYKQKVQRYFKGDD